MLSIPVANVAGQADGFVPDDFIVLLAENVLRNSALRSPRLTGCLAISLPTVQRLKRVCVDDARVSLRVISYTLKGAVRWEERSAGDKAWHAQGMLWA